MEQRQQRPQSGQTKKVSSKSRTMNGGLGQERQLKNKSPGLVVIRKKNQSPYSFYKDVCQKLNFTINSAIVHGLKNNELTLNIDNLLMNDVCVLRIVLRQCSFSSISLTGNKEFDAQAFHEQYERFLTKYLSATNGTNTAETANKVNNLSKSSHGFSSNSSQINVGKTHIKQKQQKRPSDATGAKVKTDFSTTFPLGFQQVMDYIGECIGQSVAGKDGSTLTSLKITNLPMKGEVLGSICLGLAKSRTVKELYIQNCGLTGSTIEKGMLEHMKKINSLILLDLSFNRLDGQSGGLIGRLLSSHSLNRDEQVWLCGLRGEVPESDVNLEGICEVNLMGNLLTDRSVQDLCSFLQFDGWTRSVNLRYNRIGAEGLVELNRMLDSNENLISLDIRNNPGMSPSNQDYAKFGDQINLISKSIYDKLLRNIKTFKHKREEMRRKQQEQIMTNLRYDNNNQPLPQGISMEDDQLTQQQQRIAMMQYNQNHPDQQQQQISEQMTYQQQEQQQQYGMPLQQNYIQPNFENGEEEGIEHNMVQEQLNAEADDAEEEERHQDIADEGDEDQQGGGEEMELNEDQKYIFSEEFLAIQQDNFEQLYGQNEEFLQLSEEEQEKLFQQFFLNQQKEYLIELEQHFLRSKKQEHMEGVEEVQEEQYEEDEEEQHNGKKIGEKLYNEQQQTQFNKQNNQIGKDSNQKIENVGVVKEDQVINADEHIEQHNDEGQEGDVDEGVEEDNMRQVMEQLYEELQLEQFVDKNCPCCLQLQDKVMQAEYEKLNLMIELKNCQVRLESMEQQQNISSNNNSHLKNPVHVIQPNQQQTVNSWSAIQANTFDQDNNNTGQNSYTQYNNIVGPQQPMEIGLNGEPVEGEDMLNRIEGLMTELTRLMENLETMQNNVTNNITCQLSNTSNTNNQTQQLLNSNQNFNNTLTNILGVSQNTSNILPRNQIPQQQQQILNQSPLQNITNAHQSSLSGHSGSKQTKQQQQQQLLQQQQQLALIQQQQHQLQNMAYQQQQFYQQQPPYQQQVLYQQQPQYQQQPSYQQQPPHQNFNPNIQPQYQQYGQKEQFNRNSKYNQNNNSR